MNVSRVNLSQNYGRNISKNNSMQKIEKRSISFCGDGDEEKKTKVYKDVLGLGKASLPLALAASLIMGMRACTEWAKNDNLNFTNIELIEKFNELTQREAKNIKSIELHDIDQDGKYDLKIEYK